MVAAPPLIVVGENVIRYLANSGFPRVPEAVVVADDQVGSVGLVWPLKRGCCIDYVNNSGIPCIRIDQSF